MQAIRCLLFIIQRVQDFHSDCSNSDSVSVKTGCESLLKTLNKNITNCIDTYSKSSFNIFDSMMSINGILIFDLFEDKPRHILTAKQFCHRVSDSLLGALLMV